MKPSIFLASLLAATCLAQAHTHFFQATLSGANEDIPNGSPAIGTSLVTLDLDLVEMLVQISFSGLAGGSTAAFIHAPTIFPLTGIAGPMTPALSDTGFPLGVTSGTYSHVFDLTVASGYNPSFITSSGGAVFQALIALEASFEDGTAYLSLQSSAFPNGEIRGFYTEIVPVPEPASLSMIGAAGCCLFSRRRR